MSLVTVCNCPQNTPDPACLLAMSSRPSDQQPKKHDGRTCWAGSVEWRLDGCWLNAGVGRKQCPKLVCSRSDTEELGCAGIGTWAHRAVQEYFLYKTLVWTCITFFMQGTCARFLSMCHPYYCMSRDTEQILSTRSAPPNARKISAASQA